MICLSASLSAYLAIAFSTCLSSSAYLPDPHSICPSLYLPIWLSICPSVWPSAVICLPTSTCLSHIPENSISLPTCLSLCRLSTCCHLLNYVIFQIYHTYLAVCLSTGLSITVDLPVCPSVFCNFSLSVCLSVRLSASLSRLPIYLSICPSVCAYVPA